MMFQSYALFPHMTRGKQHRFRPQAGRTAERRDRERVDEMLKLVKLEPFAKRKPHQLSGGQRQRVALARALVKTPKVLLLDEPLGALDKKLREQTQFELIDIQEQLGMTFVIVTHDQEEAMTVADRIAVMDHGRIVQVATPSEIYERRIPVSSPDFIGDINLIEAKITAVADDVTRLRAISLPLDLEVSYATQASVGDAVWFAIRPEKISIRADKPAATANAIAGDVWDIAYLGDVSNYHCRIGEGETLRTTVANATRLVERPISWDDSIWLSWSADAGIILAR